MTTAPAQRTLLPLLTTGTPSGPHGSRSHMTCTFRCGNACDRPVPNQTGHPHIQDEIRHALERRAVLRGGAVGAGLVLAGGLAASALSPAAAAELPVTARGKGGKGGKPVQSSLARLPFAPVAPNKRDAIVVPSGFRSEVVIGWGDKVTKDAPAFDVRRQTPDKARRQFGYNCDYVGVVPMPGKGDRALLVVNHEYTDEPLMFPTGAYAEADIKKIAIASHGMSVVEIKRGRTPGSWKRVPASRTRYNRRLHDQTTFVMTGPAAGHERLRTSADPSGTKVLGTFNNCAGGMTPWGTILSGEENFNQYFDKTGDLDARYTESYARYGITGAGTKGWSEVEKRFDLSQEPHEPFRFGWVVEVDPLSPGSTPRKHTMLGRFKHEGANVAVSRSGHAVAYMGDDERGDYVYKFVSAKTVRKGTGQRARAHNLTLLTTGTLYVARFTGDGTGDGEYDGTGEWLPLCSNTKSFVPGMSVAEVLLDTRLAADKLTPTRMDRPEDVEPNPVNGKVYVALTNNSNRGAKFPVDEANPLATSMVRKALGEPLTAASGNRNGYVLELTPRGGDHAGTAFSWVLMLVCGDPHAQETWFAGYDKAKVSPISCPDNVAFDSAGNLWISTDGNVLGSNDGIFRVPTAGPERGRVQQFLTVPRGAEACGPLLADGDRSLFVAVQHPGEIDGATFEAPASTWPHTDDFPRPSVAVAFRDL